MSARGPVLGRAARSLTFRYVLILVAAELAFGTVVGVLMGMQSVQTAAAERERSLRQVSSAIAAGLMPVVTDVAPGQLRRQLLSIVRQDPSGDIRRVFVKDGAGTMLADSGPVAAAAEPARGWFARFTTPKVIVEPIAFGSVTLATVTTEFEPPGLAEGLWRPLRATSVPVLLIVIVSGAWFAWFLARDFVEPIDELRQLSERIAAGDRSARVGTLKEDELGRLGRALDEMACTLEEQEQRLLESKEQIRVAAQAKSDFVAMASHELRSPLSVLRLHSEMLQEGDFGDVPPALGGAVDSIVSATERLTTIVADLMDAALIERGLMPLEPGPVDAAELVRGAVRDAAGLGAASGVSVEIAGDVPDLEIRGDAVRLRQVLDNLLSNAIKYSDGPAGVRVTARLTGSDLCVDVSDRGRGVAPEDVPGIFEPFGRAIAADAEYTAGLGLGLAISASIAAAHGGGITVRPNEDGAGSVFTLRVPLGRAEMSGTQVRA